jgi:GntR family transcriptional regulator, sialic acid-inducible nan operon repressor
MIPVSQLAAQCRIVRRKLSDEVLDRLLEIIESGEIKAGGWIPSERELMKQFGVGRPAVREALQSLAGMGIIQIQHGERARLVPFDAGTVLDRMDRSVRHLLHTSPGTRDHMRDARLMFETGMVRLAARLAKPADLETLREAIDRQSAAQGDPPRFIAADISFHKTIAAISGNPIYAALSEAMLAWMFEVFPRMLRAPGTEPLTLREHRAILCAIEAHDEERAVKALTAHLTRAHPLYSTRGRKAINRRTAKS